MIELGEFRVEVFSTPGPCREHLCYLVGLADQPESRKVLFSGDLFFCGSIGGGFFDPNDVLHHARRLWTSLPGETVVAPGHGPLSTIEIEREFNPFARG
jgi:glyoxylase-like metal-dependent hydrolase (beta-lactamase superfamily II)